jgi:hypothetical protein
MVRTDPDCDRFPVDDARMLADYVGTARIMVGAACTLAGTDRSFVQTRGNKGSARGNEDH